MILIAPTVRGPVSVCCTFIEVTGQLSGATVTIYGTKAGHRRVVARGIAKWSDASIPLPSGTTLEPNELITASQQFGNDHSPESAEPRVLVQPRPSSVQAVAFVSPLFECAGVAWVTGAVPGAEIELRVGNGPVRGFGSATTGEARFGFTPKLAAGDVLVARHTPCGMPGLEVSAPPADRLPERLPAPTIVGLVIECGRAVTIADVIPGALVTLTRSTAPPQTAAFDAACLQMVLDAELRRDEEIVVTQQFPTCRHESLPARARVQPLSAIPAPVIQGPTCTAARSADISSLVPGARVQLLFNGTDLGTCEASAERQTVQLPPLTAAGSLTARQQLCGQWGAASQAVAVEAPVGTLPAPSIDEPLHECGAAVSVRNIVPGTWLTVISRTSGAQLAIERVTGKLQTVRVAPLLVRDHEIIAVASGCQGQASSHPRIVRGRPDLRRPKVEQTRRPTDRSVTLSDLISGAGVDFYVNGQWQGSHFTGRDLDILEVLHPLRAGDVVTVRQRICSGISPLSDGYTVEDPPVARFTPSVPQGNAPLQVTFTNQSSGRIDKCTWTIDGVTQPTTAQLTSPIHTFAQPGAKEVTLTVQGPGGANTASAVITVLEQGYDEVKIWNCNSNGYSVRLWFRRTDMANASWTEMWESPRPHAADEWGTCPPDHGQGAAILGLNDGGAYEVAITAPQNAGCNSGRPDEQACLRGPLYRVTGKQGGGTMEIKVN